jgi:hypothetical protein
LGVGVRVAQSSTEREISGRVALALPLDDFAKPRVLASAETSGVTAEERESDEAAQPPPKQSSKEPEPAPEAFPLALGTWLKLSRDTVRQALSIAGASEEAERLDSLAARARSSAVLPDLRLRAARSDDQALRLAPTVNDPNRYTVADGTDFLLEASATWHLSRLVFANEEVAVSRIRLEREKARALLVERVLQRLLAWRRALTLLLDPATPPAQVVKAELELVDAVTALEVMTGGAFGDRLRELGLAVTEVREGAPRAESAAPPGEDAERPVTDGRTSRFALSTPRDVGRHQEQSPGPPKACSGAKGVSLTSLP